MRNHRFLFVPLAASLLLLAAPPPARAVGCVADDETLCLLDGRFRVQVEWTNQHPGGGQGRGQAAPWNDRTGAFWFFEQDNLEVIVKVLDGRPVNGDFWVFLGALTDVEFRLTVDDTVGGGHEVYYNPPGHRYGIADTTAFGPSGALCGGFAGIPCAEGFLCDPVAGQCLVADVAGLCVPQPEGCTADYVPVCGCDGVTYGNDCERLLVGAAKLHDGECGGAGGAFCGGFTGEGCDPGRFCNFLDGTCGAADAPGSCVLPPDPQICDMILAPPIPVCGCDGVTYPTDCHRLAAGVSRLHAGPCTG